MKPIDYEKVEDTLSWILDRLDEIESITLVYAYYLDGRVKYIIIVRSKYETSQSFEFVSHHKDMKLADMISEFKYKVLDAAEELAEKYLYNYISKKYPNAKVKNVEITRGGYWKKVKMNIIYDNKEIELRLRLYKTGKDADPEEECIIIWEMIKLSFTEDDLAVYPPEQQT